MKKESENKINAESLNAFEEFQKKKKESNLKIYKIIILLILIFNIASIIFYIIFKYNIYSIIKSNSFLNENIIEKENELNSIVNKNEKMMVNLISYNYQFCYIFKKFSEIDLIRNSILENFGDKYFHDIDNIKLLLIYQSLNEGDNKQTFINKIIDFEGVAIIIETTFRERFGIFFSKPINFSDNKTECVIIDEKAFLFSLDSKKIFKIKKEEKEKPVIKFSLEGNAIFEIGDGDIIINDNFYKENGMECKFNFPKIFEGNSREIMDRDKFSISVIEVVNFY